MTVRVLVADDHTMVREGLVRALAQAGFEVVGQAGDGEEAVAKAVAHSPDVVLMDLSLPVLSGTAATRRICAQVPGTAVMVLSMLSDDTAVVAALAAGAAGYMVKDCTTAELLDAVTRVADGQRVISPSIGSAAGRAERAHDDTGPSRPRPHSATTRPVAIARDGSGDGDFGSLASEHSPHLSRREEEVLRLMSTGIPLADAADQLFISVKTLKNHLSSIYRKLDCHDRAQAVLKAIRMGLVQVD